jgi:hypothetical protein
MGVSNAAGFQWESGRRNHSERNSLKYIYAQAYICIMKRFTINIDDELHKRFKIACTLEGIEMTSIVLKAIEDYVDRVEKRKLIVLLKKR